MPSSWITFLAIYGRLTLWSRIFERALMASMKKNELSPISVVIEPAAPILNTSLSDFYALYIEYMNVPVNEDKNK